MSQLLYVATTEDGNDLPEEFLSSLKLEICKVGKMSSKEVSLLCLNNPSELALATKDLDMSNHDNWSRLKVILVPYEGPIRGYSIARLLENFKCIVNDGETEGRNSFEILRELIEADEE
jgi:hypothetical protein